MLFLLFLALTIVVLVYIGKTNTLMRRIATLENEIQKLRLAVISPKESPADAAPMAGPGPR